MVECVQFQLPLVETESISYLNEPGPPFCSVVKVNTSGAEAGEQI